MAFALQFSDPRHPKAITFEAPVLNVFIHEPATTELIAQGAEARCDEKLSVFLTLEACFRPYDESFAVFRTNVLQQERVVMSSCNTVNRERLEIKHRTPHNAFYTFVGEPTYWLVTILKGECTLQGTTFDLLARNQLLRGRGLFPARRHVVSHSFSLR